ncbi:MAG: hydrolase [Alphaproteobacteria bacterium]|jgi:nicotinamidase-related amidase
MKLNADNSAHLAIDLQERLLPAMAAPGAVIQNVERLIKGARFLGVPQLASVHYPRGLGPLVTHLEELLRADEAMEKIAFSCMGDDGIARRVRELGRLQVILSGIEAHICVLQTALDLKALGYHVFVVSDAVSSRTEASKAAALDRLRGEDVAIVTTEMVLFEWLGKAGSPEFKKISALVK